MTPSQQHAKQAKAILARRGTATANPKMNRPPADDGDTPPPATKVTPAPVFVPPKVAKPLTALTLNELRAECDKAGITFKNKHKEAKLIALLAAK